jgi:hypothetical protein
MLFYTFFNHLESLPEIDSGYGTIVSSLEEFLRGFATFGMIVHVIQYIVNKA